MEAYDVGKCRSRAGKYWLFRRPKVSSNTIPYVVLEDTVRTHWNSNTSTCKFEEEDVESM